MTFLATSINAQFNRTKKTREDQVSLGKLCCARRWIVLHRLIESTGIFGNWESTGESVYSNRLIRKWRSTGR
jgi:hypothetical protein